MTIKRREIQRPSVDLGSDSLNEVASELHATNFVVSEYDLQRLKGAGRSIQASISHIVREAVTDHLDSLPDADAVRRYATLALRHEDDLRAFENK